MKLPEKKKPKKQKMKNKPISKPNKEKVLVVAQEFKFARLLSGNEKKTRDRVLKTFKKWLLNCFEKGYEFKEDDFIRVWKGLFYAVWMSDKPLIQEDLCDSIAEILDLFPMEQIANAILMTKAGFKVLATEWYGIDQHRMDKFLMLVRRYLRGGFRCLLRCDWSLSSCELFSEMLSSSDGILAIKTPLYARNSLSMILHITDCYLEELSKVSQGSIPDESLVALLKPFSALVCASEGERSVSARRLLTALVRQSALGLEYDDAARAWQRMGCPAGGPDALERVSDNEDDGEQPEETMDDDGDDSPPALDPRAGRVSVSLRPLPVPGALLAAQLHALRGAAAAGAWRRARVCAQRFEALANNQYPLKIAAADSEGLEPNLDRAEPMRAASRLQKLEKTLVHESDELALRGLSRKHRKRLLARSRSGISLVDEMEKEKTDSTNGDWKIETTEQESKKSDSNKENKNAKKKNRKRKHQEEKMKKDDNVQENNKKHKINNVANKEINSKKNENKINDSPKEKDVKVKNKIINTTNNLNTQNGVNKNKLKKEKVKKAEQKVLSPNNKDNKKTDKTKNDKEIKQNGNIENKNIKKEKQPKLVVNKIKNYQKQVASKKESPKKILETPKKVKFVLKNNSMQGAMEYYKSVRQSPNIPYDSSKKPTKTNLKPSTPSPINPFFKKKFKLKN